MVSPCSDENPYSIKRNVTIFMRLKMLVATLAALQASKAGWHDMPFTNNIFFHSQEDQSLSL